MCVFRGDLSLKTNISTSDSPGSLNSTENYGSKIKTLYKPFPQPRKQCSPLTWQDLARSPGLSGTHSDHLLCPNSDPCLGTLSREAQSPREEKAQRFPWLRGRAVSQRGRSLVPRKAQPQRPNSPFSAPTDRRRAKHGPDPTGGWATWDRRSAKRARGAAHCPCSKAANLPALTLSFPRPQPPLPPAPAVPPCLLLCRC